MLKKRLYKIFAVSVFFCVAITELRSQPALDFRHLAVEDGLSNGSVLSITQDANGFIWIGTMDGLNRYDGKRVKIYKSFYKDNPAGGGMKITQLVADQYQRLWIGTDNGLYCYDSKIDSFRYFSHKGNSIEGLSNNSVKALYLDRSNYLWIGTENGLDKIKLGPRDDDYKVAHVSLVENGPAFLSHNIQAIFETADGGYWIGTQNGLLILGEKPKNKYAVARKVFSSMPVSSFAEDRGHNIWIGSSANGVYRLNRQTGHIDSFTHADGIISNVIRKIHVDKQGNVWAGSLKGLMLYNPASRSFRSFVHKPEDNRTLTYNSVYALYEDAQGNIWVGTYFGGANIAEAISTPFTVYKNEENKNSVSSNVISSIVSDSLDNLWIGTEAEGLNYYDRKKDLFYHFKNEENNPHSLSSDLVKMILKDKEDRIWVGLNNGILDELSTDKKQFRHYTIYGGGGASTGDGIVSLAEDGRNNIWVWKITTGLYIMNKKEGRARAFQEFFPDKNLSNPGLTYLFADSRKCVWIGTRKGLNVMDSSQTQIRAYFAKDGLQSDYI
ncbi:MAG: hypothetical protein J7539_18310, partial [Niabella sp.]|nr:hypothetical protein [Niabella sp.]